ncbi:MAG: hypothetical protein IH951_16355 [Bacteroidetes bacterium]|nr:hypothetical protein [Bacteroidota bacterium]
MARPVLYFAFDPKVQEPVEENEPTPVVPFRLVEQKSGLYVLEGGEGVDISYGKITTVEIVKYKTDE